MQFIIGIDIGTTHTKAVVVTTLGEVCAEFKKGYLSSKSAGSIHEQDPEEIFEAMVSVLADAHASIESPNDLLSVCISAAMHSLIPVDSNGTPLMPMMTWADTRSNAQAIRLKKSEAGSLIYERTGTPIHPMSPLCKITWLREETPELFSTVFKFISIKEFIWHKLFDEFVTDHSIASSSGMLDIETLTYSEDALKYAGISAAHLSSLVPITYSRKGFNGRFKPSGIEPEPLFIIGASDGFLANLGSGAIRSGEAALTIGTSGAVRSLQKKIARDQKQRLFNYAIAGNLWLTGGAINNGGIVLKWFIDSFFDGRIADINQIVEAAKEIKPGSDGLIFLPYVYGERAPVWDASAKGVFFGISAGHTKFHFLRAVLEGIAFSLRQILEALEENSETIQCIHASGGFIESPVWLEIVSDVLGKKIIVSQVADASAMGAVYLAMKAHGIINDWEDVKKFGSAEKNFLPNAESHKNYQHNYKIYCKLYEQLKDNFGPEE